MPRGSIRAWAQSLRTPLGGALLILAVMLAVLTSVAVVTVHHAAVREYWIAVVPVQWNIVPTGKDELSGTTYDTKATTFQALIYRPYTAYWASPRADPYGVMPGPTLYGEVGDNLVIHFKNLDSALHRPHSMHPHGVRYTPEHDGAYV